MLVSLACWSWFSSYTYMLVLWCSCLWWQRQLMTKEKQILDFKYWLKLPKWVLRKKSEIKIAKSKIFPVVDLYPYDPYVYRIVVIQFHEYFKSLPSLSVSFSWFSIILDAGKASVYKMSPDPWQLVGGRIQTYIRVFENGQKVAFNIASENSQFWWVFENL